MPQLFGHQYTKQQLLELVGDMTQLAGARRAELVEGNERGSDLVEVFNASGLCFSILPGRSLDIASAHYKGMSLGFRGNTGDVGPYLLRAPRLWVDARLFWRLGDQLRYDLHWPS